MSDFDSYIDAYLDSLDDNLISRAMAYAIKGGKHFRPLLIFSLLEGFGIEEKKGYDAALALEMIHTYSLIHDDLPAMDNDDMRRGKPSLHKAFREDIAILTGDQLLTDAFRVIASSKLYDDQVKVGMINDLSTYAGNKGMIYGQLLDVTNDDTTIDADLLKVIQDNKTGGLFKIACLMAMRIAGIENEGYFIRLGSMIGEIFQDQDDLFDMIKSEEQMGKNLSDAKNHKGTALCIYTVDELENIIDELFSQLDGYLENAMFDPLPVRSLMKRLKER